MYGCFDIKYVSKYDRQNTAFYVENIKCICMMVAETLKIIYFGRGIKLTFLVMIFIWDCSPCFCVTNHCFPYVLTRNIDLHRCLKVTGQNIIYSFLVSYIILNDRSRNERGTIHKSNLREIFY